MELKAVCVSGGTWGIKMPQNINVVSGTCVTIPCFFDVARNHKINLDHTCEAYWVSGACGIKEIVLLLQYI
uniref:Uncharacterized protein n=1 Tax=Oreochromis aureus TaxID=47969 RepID=A0AAZ1XXQ8_OREAU